MLENLKNRAENVQKSPKNAENTINSDVQRMQKRKHLPVCSEGMRRAAIRRSVFLRSYPDYCRKCSAYGIEWREDFEGMLQDYNCPECLEKDLCPRCMTLTMVSKQDRSHSIPVPSYQTCSKCKWRGDDDYGDKYGLPNKPICVCTLRENS